MENIDNTCSNFRSFNEEYFHRNVEFRKYLGGPWNKRILSDETFQGKVLYTTEGHSVVLLLPDGTTQHVPICDIKFLPKEE